MFLYTQDLKPNTTKEAIVKMMIVAFGKVIMGVNTAMKVIIARMPRIFVNMMVERMIT